MPDMSENPTKAGTEERSHPTRREARTPGRGPGEPGDAPPGPPRAGALFRALLKAGCDLETAYTAAEEAKRMAGENVATENVVTLTHLADSMGTLLANVDKLAERVVSQGEKLDKLAERVVGQGEKLDALSQKVDRLTERVDSQGEKLDRLAERVEQQGEKLDALSEKVDRHGEILVDHGTRLEVLAVRMEALQREMRLMWGALGALVTVLGLVFTLLFSR